MEESKERHVSETADEKVTTQECSLEQVEKGLDESTKVLFQDFQAGRIDATMTVTGLQLVQDAREACARGDLGACKRLGLIKGFLEGVPRRQ